MNKYNGIVVATSGIFDIYHAGYCDLLQFASIQGDILIVGINSDKSTKIIKGKDRPINSQENRKKVLEFIRCVKRVEIFNELDASGFLERLKPDVWVKSSEYNIDKFTDKEREVIKKYNIQVKFCPHLDGISTTKILEKINKL